ncbi:alpha/beta hydrolase [Amycolatopsis sp. NPDC049868]|uniref:alpha/beta hydrolase n=1 Tax=Amycolatopsis sp. NPDC049868 TaxID=3363934 RepID=UPI0037A130FE
MPKPENDRQPAVNGASTETTRRRFVLGAAAGMASIALCGATGRASAAPSGTGAVVVGERQVGDGVLDLAVLSPALGTTAMVRLLLPEGWTSSPSRTWPVLYLLHGAGDDYTSWTRSTDVTRLTCGKGMLVVMPSGGRNGFYSDWLNYGAGGTPKWETFHLTELRQLLERGYGAGSERAIAGLSMGGLGAMAYAARHPGMFVAAASYSGVVHTTYQGARGSSLIQGVLIKEGLDPFALWGDPQLNADVWAAHNPYALAPQLTGIPLYVACGNGQPGPLDPPGTPPDPLIEPLCGEMSTAFVQRLREVGATVTADLYGPGTHSWPWWQRDLHRSLPLLANAIGSGADG